MEFPVDGSDRDVGIFYSITSNVDAKYTKLNRLQTASDYLIIDIFLSVQGCQ